MRAMKLFLKIMIAGYLSIASAQAGSKDGCTHTWGKGDYRSFRQIEAELHTKFGNVKILRMALCGVGGQPYFQVTVLQPSGTVNNLQVPAH